MMLYIDPGTGSMLFAVLVGIIGALNFLLKGWIIKLRFLLSGGKSGPREEKKIPLAIFSEGKRYWSIFEPVCRELDKRGVDTVFMTASPDDPALENQYPHIHAEFIGEGNKAFAKLNFLKANVLLATTPGLDVYQWKRSKDVDFYVHILHAASEVVTYRMFGLDYYDAVFVSGDYQTRDLRALEKLRNLPPREVEKIGVPYLDEMKKRLERSGPVKAHPTTVLVAPSWGPSAIFSKFGGKIIDKLVEAGFHVIVRPHPQSFTSEKELMEELMKEYPQSEQVEWNRDADNFEVLRRSDILISDFSGVIFDFALVFDKPVIYADTQFDKGPYDCWWLDTPLWTFEILPKIGEQLTQENFDALGTLVAHCMKDEKYTQGRNQAREETWAYPGESAVRAVEYLEKKVRELAGKNKENEQ